MRAPVFILAIVICTVTALAVLSKSRAESDVAADQPDTAVAQGENSDSDATSASESAGNEPKITTDDAEQIICGVYQDDARIWGNGISWTQLKSQSPADDTLRQRSFSTSVYCVSDLSAHPFGSPYRDRYVAGKAYLDAARKLDEVANDLEEAKLFRDADQLRDLTAKLRTRGRSFPSESETQTFDSGGIRLAR
jgi:hypothetical protein